MASLASEAAEGSREEKAIESSRTDSVSPYQYRDGNEDASRVSNNTNADSEIAETNHAVSGNCFGTVPPSPRATIQIKHKPWFQCFACRLTWCRKRGQVNFHRNLGEGGSQRQRYVGQRVLCTRTRLGCRGNERPTAGCSGCVPPKEVSDLAQRASCSRANGENTQLVVNPFSVVTPTGTGTQPENAERTALSKRLSFTKSDEPVCCPPRSNSSLQEVWNASAQRVPIGSIEMLAQKGSDVCLVGGGHQSDCSSEGKLDPDPGNLPSDHTAVFNSVESAVGQEASEISPSTSSHSDISKSWPLVRIDCITEQDVKVVFSVLKKTRLNYSAILRNKKFNCSTQNKAHSSHVVDSGFAVPLEGLREVEESLVRASSVATQEPGAELLCVYSCDGLKVWKGTGGDGNFVCRGRLFRMQ